MKYESSGDNSYKHLEIHSETEVILNNIIIIHISLKRNFYILRVVLVIIMEFHWFIGRDALCIISPVDTHVGVAYDSHRCFG